MAIAALEVARYEFGLEIGPEIGIAGFDDIEQASWPSFDLTTYSYPLPPMIETVVSVILGTHQSERPNQTIVDGTLKARRSTQRSKR